MSAQKTKFPKFTVPARKIHQGTTIVGKNGLPVDALATIEPGTTLVVGANNSISYSAPTVTINGVLDISILKSYTPKHIGELLFTDISGGNYFIDPSSVNINSQTFNIYTDESFISIPTSINTDQGWFASEAELVNRLQTTSSAVVDSVEFRDVEIKFQLDGDPVKIIDSDKHELNILPDGSIPTTEQAATTPNIQNISIPAPNVEQSFTFPIGTRKITLRVRGNGTLRYSFIAGQSGTVYITVPPGFNEVLDNLNLDATLTLYFQSSKGGETLEIISWT